MPDATPAPANADFYVGYLSMPTPHLFYIRLLMPVALWLAVGAAALVSSSQSDPGPGVWNSGAPQSFEGVLAARPYPLLRVPGGKDGAAFTTFLLVETGKFGADKRAAPFNGQYVRVQGWLIERDERRMIELDPGDPAIQALAASKPAVPGSDPDPSEKLSGTMTLRGEIVDSKCFLGVMKPGHGKTHKECATLCIAGGIPPMLVTQNASGGRSYYLLTDPDGAALDNRVLPFVADPVEVIGRLSRIGDLQFLRIDPSQIARR